MAKIALLASIISAMSIGAVATVSNNLEELPERDTSLIVEVDRSLEGLSVEEITDSQNVVIKRIANEATRNFKVDGRFNVLNNAFVINCNSEDVAKIKEVKGVKSISENKLHWKKTVNHDLTYSISAEPTAKNAPGDSSNVSAQTMNFPDSTNEGEGTVIAILDNEFYFQGEKDERAAWCHETFSPLEEGVYTRWTYAKVKNLTHKNCKAVSGKTAGQEGSLYFNNKVPFYYDYGGTAATYGSNSVTSDYDVMSEISYHGSHVASIAGGNAPTYKGIAPKAQLACMKVFTEYKVDSLGEKIGFQSYSGAYDKYILAALEDCITMGVDGINMSLGSDLDDFDQNSITLKTLNKLAKSNILTSIAAGNSGKSSYAFAGAYGNWTKDMVETGILSSYANCEPCTTVASAQPTRIFYENALVVGQNNDLVAFDDQVVNREGLPKEYDEEHKLSDLYSGSPLKYVYTGKFGNSSDYTSEIKSKVKGNIAVVNRGVTSFEDKYFAAKDAGAKALIIINNDPTSTDFNFRCSFGSTKPEIPVSLVLFKDKPYFDNNPEGTFELIHNQEEVNKTPKTMSTYSSDGAAFNFDLKPEIATPGESIKGATPPQTAEEKTETPLNTYKYLSGTSMAAPNYAGVQSVMLSKDGIAKTYYKKISPTKVQTEEFNKYKNSIDMRLASTADPMLDRDECPEESSVYIDQEKKVNYSSPRLQGAGMVDMSSALTTKVYLEGLDVEGNATGKAKVSLKNSEEIAKGNIKIDVIAHNEAADSLTYKGKLTVMRPATIMNNDIVTKDHDYKGEISDVSLIPGLTYYTINGFVTNIGEPKDGDALKVEKVINVWSNETEWIEDHTYNPTTGDYDENKTLIHAFTFEIGNYKYNSAIKSDFKWEKLESNEYQSVQDKVLAVVDLGNIVIPAGDNKVSLTNYSLSDEVKKEILRIYEYGCVIEGYVTLTSNTEPELSIPYLGYYSGTDVDASRSLDNAPVVEPFAFEKDEKTVYPSDLSNNIAKTLVGKDNANMGSMWVTGYAESIADLNTEKVLTNDEAFDKWVGWKNVGTDPITGKYVADAKNNIYVGDRTNSNTMIIQQYVMRSVKTNYFDITNEKGDVVYRSSLQDMLFGEQGGEYPLYKSHVDASYLAAGYIAHRAYAAIPLYNPDNGQPFASGKYKITFNYVLANNEHTVSKSYDFNIVSDGSKFVKAEKYEENGEAMMKFTAEGEGIISAGLGFNKYEVTKSGNQTYFNAKLSDVTKAIKEVSAGTKSSRLFVSFNNAAFASTNVIFHFNNDYESYSYIEGQEFTSAHDFEEKGDLLVLVKYDEFGDPEQYVATGKVRTNTNCSLVAKGGCGGSIIAASFVVFGVSLIAVMLLTVRKIRSKKEN